MWASAAALVGAIAGAFLPALIASLPERDPDAPTDTTYAAIAAAPHLRVRLALVAGGVSTLLGATRAGQPDVLAFVLLAVLGTALGYVDLRRHLLPDRLTLPTLLSGALLLGGASLASSQYDMAAYGRAWACAGGLMLLYLALAMLYPAGLGLGDVKLAAALGLYLGWLGWSYPVVGTVAAFLVGGVVSLALLASGRAGRRTAVPFGPPMLLGALAAVLWAEPVTAWYLG